MLERPPRDCPEIGGGGAGQHDLYGDAGARQLVRKVLAEDEDEGLAATIDAVQGLRIDSDDRGDVDDCPRAPRDKLRDDGVGQAGQGRDVERDQRRHLVDVRIEQRQCSAKTRIVDEQGDVRRLPQERFDACKVRCIREIGGEDIHLAPGPGADPFGNIGELVGAARNQHKIIAPFGQPVGIDRSDTARCTGDDGCPNCV